MNDDILARTLTGRASESEIAEVMAWRNQSAQNEQRFQAIARLLAIASGADETHTPGPPPAAAAIVAASGAVARMSGARTGRHGTARAGEAPRGPSIGRLGAVAAAAVVLLIAGSSYLLRPASPGTPFGVQKFVTGPSEQATVVLTDGTVVRLAAESQIVVPNGASRREVTLDGRAYFAVAHDESQPFIVRTGSGEVVRVLGTRFVLDASGEDLRLVVVEGRVALSAVDDEEELQVSESQMARVVRGIRLPVIQFPDSIAPTDWVGNFLAFQDTPIRDAAREIERAYGVTIDLSDPTLAERTITAWFAGWELEDVMEVVCVVANARCETEGSFITVRPFSPP